ncbi:polyprotein [Basavirus sp.]|nr:polyprotein [Basavirus sp.]
MQSMHLNDYSSRCSSPLCVKEPKRVKQANDSPSIATVARGLDASECSVLRSQLLIHRLKNNLPLYHYCEDSDCLVRVLALERFYEYDDDLRNLILEFIAKNDKLEDSRNYSLEQDYKPKFRGCLMEDYDMLILFYSLKVMELPREDKISLYKQALNTLIGCGHDGFFGVFLDTKIFPFLTNVIYPRDNEWHLKTRVFNKFTYSGDFIFEEDRVGLTKFGALPWVAENYETFLLSFSNLIQYSNRKQRKFFRRNLRACYYSRYLDFSNSFMFYYYSPSNFTLRRISQLRRILKMGHPDDDYYDEHYTAESDDGNDPVALGVLGSLRQWMNTQFGQKTNETYQQDPRRWYTKILKKIFGAFIPAVKYGISLFGDTTKGSYDWFARIISSISGVFVKIFSFPYKLASSAFEVLKSGSLLIVALIVCIFGFLGSVRLISVLTALTGYHHSASSTVTVNILDKEELLRKAEKNKFTAEAPDGLVSIGAVLLALFNWGAPTKDRIGSWSATLVKLVAAGTIMKYSALYLVSFLPSMLRNAITYEFGDTTTKFEMDLDDWRIKVSTLLASSKNPHVLTSPEFRNMMVECIEESAKMKQVRNVQPHLRSIFTAHYLKLIHLRATISQYENSSPTKDLPFCVHIFGEPGVGKTSLARRILGLFGATTEDIYPVPKSDYMDGYMGQKYLYWDEFLGGPQDRIEKDAEKYLQMISTAKFIPELPSVDNVNSGIKGTVCAPKVVITLNNSYTKSLTSFKSDAMDRRRNVVIHLTHVARTPYKGETKNVDTTKYTPEQVRNVAWLRAQFLDPVNHQKNLLTKKESLGFEPNHKFDFTSMCEIMRNKYMEHQELIKTLNMIGGIETDPTPSPGDIISGLHREFLGIPNERANLKEILMKYLISSSLPSLTRSIYRKALNLFSTEMMSKSTCDDGVIVSENPFQILESPNETEYESCKEQHKDVASVAKVLKKKKKNKQPPEDGTVTPMQAFCDLVTLHDYIELETHHSIITTCLHEDPDQLMNDSEYLKCLKESQERYAHLTGYVAPVEKKTLWQYRWFDFGIMIILGLVCYSVAKYCKSLFSGNDEEQEEEEIMFAHGSSKSSSETEEQRKKMRTRAKAKPQKGFNEGGYKSENGGVSLALFHFDDIKIKAVPIEGRKFLTYYHWGIQRIRPDQTRIITNLTHGGITYERIEIDVAEHMVTLPEKDFCIISLEHVKRIPLAASIINKFISDSKLFDVPAIFNIRVTSTEKDNYGLASLLPRKFTYRVEKDGETVGSLTVDWVVKANISSRAGDCGHLASFADGCNLAGTFIGIHIAGSNDKDRNPTSIISLITKEDLRNAISVLESSSIESFVGEGPEEGEIEFPNLIRTEQVEFKEIVYLPDKSVIEPTILHGRLPEKTSKQPAIMSISDVRSQGRDPVEASLSSLFNVEQLDLDECILDDVFDSMETFYKKKLIWPIGKRQLTKDEAIRGVPGYLTSVNTSTSPGYPLIFTARSKGKTDHIRISQDGYWTSAMFDNLLERKLEEMAMYDRNWTIDHRFIGYLKDEPLSEKKIQEGRTRMIFCNSMVSSVAFRMKTGCLLAAFYNSWQKTPVSIGMNQNSWDMDDIYIYLSKIGDRYLSADFKNFDQRHVRQIRERSYQMLRNLLGDVIDDKEWDYIFDHETKSPLQIRNRMYWLKSNHFSGCFFTTILNCLVSEAYIRYCFTRLDPTLVYWEDYRIRTLGDDNIISVSDRVNITPLDIQRVMKELGQDFTHSLKDQQLTENWFKFEEITFLGTQPIFVNGQWCGAQLKSSLWETVQWKRSKIADLREVVLGCMEKCSIWDREFFDYYCKSINDILIDELIKPVIIPYYETRRKVCLAKTKPSLGFKAESDDPVRALKPAVGGLTIMPVETGYEESQTNMMNQRADLSAHAINEQRMDLDFGLNSIIFRQSVNWDSSSSGVIFSTEVPFGLLALGETENIQNMPFERFIYMVNNIQIIAQVNGSPFQQGLCVLFFAPLAKLTDSVPSQANIYNYHHVRIQPNESGSHCLNISTQWFRSVLNTFAGALGQDSLGYVGLYVVSPFLSVNPGQATIVINSRFNGSGFSIPRPLPSSSMIKKDAFSVQRFKKLAKKFGVGKNAIDRFTAEGAAGSKTNTTTIYNIGDVVGSVPIQTEIGSTATASAEGSLQADVKGLPMDKPPLASGSIPTFGILPSNSKNVSVEQVMAMQHHPMMMHREPMAVSNNQETSIEHLCSLPTIIYSIPWLITQPPNTELLNFPLNSIFRDLTDDQMFAGFEVGTPIAVLNMAQFWRCDVEITIEAIKTPFHAGRIVATLAYGTPSLEPADKNVYYNKVLNYSHDNSVERYLVNFNAATEFLRTYSGNLVLNPIQDQAIGRVMLTVHTQLAAPDTVSPLINLLVSVRLLNVRVYEANSLFPINSIEGQGTLKVVPSSVDDEEEEETDEQKASSAYSTTETTTKTTTTTQKPTTTKTTTRKQGSGYLPPSGAYRPGDLNPADARYVWEKLSNGQFGWVKRYKREIDDINIDDLDFTAEGEGAPIQGEESEILDPPPADEATKDESHVVNNPVCGIQTGRKFEYTITYLEEFLRRYNLTAGYQKANVFANLSGVNDLTSAAIMIPVTYGNVITSLFRMWSGHLNYRGLVKSNTIPIVRLYNSQIEEFPTVYYPLPFTANGKTENRTAQPMLGTLSTTNNLQIEGGNVTTEDRLYLGYREVEFIPNEFLTPMPNDYWYLNVSVPFNTNYNGIPPLPAQGEEITVSTMNTPCFTQSLVINRTTTLTGGDNGLSQNFVVTKSVGDDFKLQVYCPTRLWWRPINLNSRPTVDGRMYVGGMVFGKKI